MAATTGVMTVKNVDGVAITVGTAIDFAGINIAFTAGSGNVLATNTITINGTALVAPTGGTVKAGPNVITMATSGILTINGVVITPGSTYFYPFAN